MTAAAVATMGFVSVTDADSPLTSPTEGNFHAIMAMNHWMRMVDHIVASILEPPHAWIHSQVVSNPHLTVFS